MRLLRLFRAVVWLVLLATAGLVVWNILRPQPQDLPWTPLDLALPTGAFTGRKIAGLADDPARCRALLAEAGARTIGTAIAGRAACGQPDAIRLADNPGRPAYRPGGLATSCPVDAGLLRWERDYVQPAALDLLGARVVRIDHFGSYACRPIYGRPGAALSEHATANALDVAGFRLADGRRITVAADWRGAGAEADFLHQVRDGACRLFATVLSPDYNAAHRDHLHLDQARRSATGWRACR